MCGRLEILLGVNISFTFSCTSGHMNGKESITPPRPSFPAREGRFYLLLPKWLQLLIVETFYSAEEAVL